MLVEIRKYFSSGSCVDPQLRSGRRIPGRITANRLRCFIDPSCKHKSPTRETVGILNPGARKGNGVIKRRQETACYALPCQATIPRNALAEATLAPCTSIPPQIASERAPLCSFRFVPRSKPLAQSNRQSEAPPTAPSPTAAGTSLVE